MLEAEIDVFSGMPNPTFELSEKQEAELLERIVADASQMSPVTDPTANFGLGYRGIVIRQVKSDGGPWSTATLPRDVSIARELVARPGALPIEFRLSRPATRASAGESTGDWLLKVAERKALTISDEVREELQRGVRVLPDRPKPDENPPEQESLYAAAATEEAVAAPRGATWWACNSPFYAVNHEVFNRPEYVGRNNCYCFASNVLANIRYALPGKRGGRPATIMSCGNVVDGLRADGWIDGCQSNTLTIAMVIWPGQDYHFYRVVTGGTDWWWEHKPGGTPARWWDESGQNLFRGLAPINCNRGNYIHFCGFFYQNNYTAYVA
jgi:hypothetical protein